jgi:DNA gyrase subunit A
MLRNGDATPEERAAYLRMANQARRSAGEDVASDEQPDPDAEAVPATNLSQDRFEELKRLEEFVLTVSERGFGKRTSSYEYRLAGRGGQGIWNMEMGERNGAVVAAFPVRDDQQVIMVTDGGQVIRMPIHDVRVAGRKTQGVTLFRVAPDEHVVSVAELSDDESDANGNGNGGGDDAEAAQPGDSGDQP